MMNTCQTDGLITVITNTTVMQHIHALNYRIRTSDRSDEQHMRQAIEKCRAEAQLLNDQRIQNPYDLGTATQAAVKVATLNGLIKLYNRTFSYVLR